MKKTISIWFAGLLVLAMAACSATPAASTAGSTVGQAESGTPQPNQQRTLNTETELLLGTFKLEGTDQAVTQEQAAELLPLWKAVKALSTSETTSSEEINALYQQIQETMTSDQMKAIDAMNLTAESTTEIMQQAGITPEAGFGGFSGTASPEQQATREALRASGNFPSGGSGGFPGGGGGGGAPAGGGGGGGGGGFPSGGGEFTGGERSGQNGETNGQFATAIASRGGATGMRVDESLVTALISLLEQRAG
jgi:hypothetical protein